MTITFTPKDKRFWNPRGAVRCGSGVQLFVQTREVAGLSVCLRKDGENNALFLPMTPCESGFSLRLDQKEPGLYFLSFLADGQRYGKDGNGNVLKDGIEWPVLFFDSAFETPDWLSGGVIYQIFPDRFAKEGKIRTEGVHNKRTLHQNVSERPLFIMDEPNYEATDFYGGNIAGIRSRLPYLASLGVTALYFNPMFEAASNHRYNTADYRRIDPMLGTNEEFAALCSEAHDLGMKVILDGVFSHTGADSRYFNRYGNYPDLGAYQSADSPYAGWYSFGDSREDYACWWGFKTLPNVNETDPTYLEFICGEDGVLRYWMRLGADGWRLDVADELPDRFLEEVRKAIKAEKEDAYLLGEVWEDAALKYSYGARRKFLQGLQVDSVMNYPFRGALIDACKGKNAHLLADGVNGLLDVYPAPAVKGLMNLLSTHDTWRILNVLGLERSVTREEEVHVTLTPLEETVADQRLRRVALLQFFLPGVPSIYYGDEIGMTGCGDPWNRKFFSWERIGCPLQEYFASLGRLRKDFREMFSGEFTITAHSEAHLEMRWEKDEKVLGLSANFSSSPLPIPEAADAACYLTLGGLETNEGAPVLEEDSILVWQLGF